MLSHIPRLVQWAQAGLIFALQPLAGSKVWVAPPLILLMIWIIVESVCKRKNQIISTSKSKYTFSGQELNGDFDLERRLRGGKRWQSSPDRFRRAATVC